MKILHIITSLGTGGAEKLIVETIPLYNSKGIEADVLVLHGNDTPFYNQLKQLKCCNLFTLRRSSYNPISIFKIIDFLKKYDLVHTHLFSALYFTAIAKFLSKSTTPLVFTEHSTSNRRFTKPIFRKIDSLIYNRYARIISITEEVNRVVLNHTGISPQKTLVINNGINLIKYKISEPLNKSLLNNGLCADDILVLQVSSFQYPKDQITVIKSLLYLAQNVKVLFAGDGIDRKKTEVIVEELDLVDRVLFLGVRMDIPQLIKMCDIAILSSHWEGFGLVAVEAMASGKPFIASDVPGLREVVQGAGVLFPQGDEKALADEIMKLINNKQYYNEVVDKCVERAEKYDINIMVDKTIELYKSVLREVK